MEHQAFLAQHTAKAQSPLAAELELGQNKIIGKVTNRTNGPLEDVALVRGSALQYIGYMAPGESVNVNLDVESGIFDNSSPAEILPPPSGVTAPQYGGYFTGNTSNNPAQRLYDRKVELLAASLYPLVSGEAPVDMKVVMVAWGPSPNTKFDVPGFATRTEELNVWTDLAQVKKGTQARLDSAVPFAMYAPGNSPSMLPMGQTGVDILGGQTVMSYTAQLSFGSGSQSQPVPVVPPMMRSTLIMPDETDSVQISPYADLVFKLPASTKPENLTLRYQSQYEEEPAQFDVLAYNYSNGTWKKLTSVELSASTTTINLENPVQFVSDSGNITLRLLSTTPLAIRGTFEMSLNSPN